MNRVLYITAAGDAGQEWILGDVRCGLEFEGIAAPAGLIAIDPFLSGYFVQSFGGDGFITLQEGIDRLCIFGVKSLHPALTRDSPPGYTMRATSWWWVRSCSLRRPAAAPACRLAPVTSGF